MVDVKLPKGIWQFDETRRLGPPGGFGEVFLGAGPNGTVAVKRLHLTAHDRSFRELKIADFLVGHNHTHVIPIFDVGLDELSKRYFIIMARADRSLQDLVEDTPIGEAETLEIVAAIAAGLEEI